MFQNMWTCCRYTRRRFDGNDLHVSIATPPETRRQKTNNIYTYTQTHQYINDTHKDTLLHTYTCTLYIYTCYHASSMTQPQLEWECDVSVLCMLCPVCLSAVCLHLINTCVKKQATAHAPCGVTLYVIEPEHTKNRMFFFFFLKSFPRRQNTNSNLLNTFKKRPKSFELISGRMVLPIMHMFVHPKNSAVDSSHMSALVTDSFEKALHVPSEKSLLRL